MLVQRVTILLIGLFFVGACDSGHSTRQRQEQAAREITKAVVGTDSLVLSSHDIDIFFTLEDHSSAWNRAMAPLVRDYLDPNVSAEAWVQNARMQISELRAIHADLYASVISVENAEFRRVLLEIANNYRDKLNAITTLHIAVANGDVAAEREALVSVTEAASKGQALGMSLLDSLRPYVDADQLAEEARRRGREISELMKTH